MICGSNSFVIVDLRSFEQHVVGRPSINYIKLVSSTKRAYYQVKVSNPNTSIGCLMMFSRDIRTTSKTDKEMILRDDP